MGFWGLHPLPWSKRHRWSTLSTEDSILLAIVPAIADKAAVLDVMRWDGPTNVCVRQATLFGYSRRLLYNALAEVGPRNTL